MCHGITVLVRAVWKVNVSSLLPVAPLNGEFGERPTVNIPETADLQLRLIDLTGRR
jgi:hypothetical protein